MRAAAAAFTAGFTLFALLVVVADDFARAIARAFAAKQRSSAFSTRWSISPRLSSPVARAS